MATVIIKDALTGNQAEVTSDGALKVTSSGSALGAVTIKDPVTGDEATVNPAGDLNVNVTNALSFSPAGLDIAIRSQRVTVTDVATRLPATALANRNTMSVRVLGTSNVYFGDSGVTSAAGYPKFQYEEIFMDIQDNPSVDLYAICESGQTCEVAVMEIA